MPQPWVRLSNERGWSLLLRTEICIRHIEPLLWSESGNLSARALKMRSWVEVASSPYKAE